MSFLRRWPHVDLLVPVAPPVAARRYANGAAAAYLRAKGGVTLDFAKTGVKFVHEVRAGGQVRACVLAAHEGGTLPRLEEPSGQKAVELLATCAPPPPSPLQIG
jgi:hypothetical protein